MSSHTPLICPIFEGHINPIFANSHRPYLRRMDNTEFDLFLIGETEAQKIKTPFAALENVRQSCDSNSNCPDSFIVKD